jgi:hypothetical protein
MNDMALQIQFAIYDKGGPRGLDAAAVNHRLRRTLHQVDGRHVTPMDLITAVAASSRARNIPVIASFRAAERQRGCGHD